MPARVFISYAHEDRKWCDKLLTHLGALRELGRIRTFDDSEIQPGEWERQLRTELDQADVIVLVVSADFGNSRFCTGVELKEALRRFDNEGTRVLPILARHCDWKALPITRFQILPQDDQRNLRPLSDWQDPDKPLVEPPPRSSEQQAPRIASSGFWCRPERPDRVFGRESDVQPIVNALVADKPGHVVLFGTAGIGKTTVAQQAACDPAVVARFGDRRCLVRLDAADSPEALVSAVHAALGLPPAADPWSAIESNVRAAVLATPTLIVLDNLETPWDRHPAATESVLARLAHLPGVALLASLRSGEAPLKPFWQHRHEVLRLESPFDRELLFAIADGIKVGDPLLGPVLKALDGVPLAIELFAAQAQAAESLTLPWRRWQAERTTMLARGELGDRLSSLDVSLEFSLTSPRMNDEARRLYAVLGRLPAGLALDSLDAVLPGVGTQAATRLVQTRLAREQNGRLRTLAPVREHAFRQVLTNEDRGRLVVHFSAMADALIGSALQAADREPMFRARSEIDNIEFLVDWILREESLEPTEARKVVWVAARAADSRTSLGDLALAERGLRQMLRLAERLAATDPADAESQRDLSVIWSRIGDVRKAQGDLAGALRAYEDARAIVERLMAADPSNTEWQHDLSASWDRIGDVCHTQGDLAGALRAREKDLAITERLVAADPANARWQHDLSISWIKLGDVRYTQGDLAGALRACEDARVIRNRLAATDPANAEWQRALVICWDRIGDVRRAQGDFAGALRAYEDARAISERLVATDPANTEWQRDLSVSWSKFGEVRRNKGDLAGALRAHEDARAIDERLVATDPANTEWQRDLSISWTKVGDVRRAQGDLAGALRAYEAGRAITERLAATDPANTEWQRDFSVSWDRIGDARRKKGDLAGALRAYEDSRAIRERLAATDPANAEWQRDLIVSAVKVAEVAHANGESAQAASRYRVALAIAQELQDSHRLPPVDSWMIEDLRRRLKALEGEGVYLACLLA